MFVAACLAGTAIGCLKMGEHQYCPRTCQMLYLGAGGSGHRTRSIPLRCVPRRRHIKTVHCTGDTMEIQTGFAVSDGSTVNRELFRQRDSWNATSLRTYVLAKPVTGTNSADFWGLFQSRDGV
jgi:hypothetical protein